LPGCFGMTRSSRAVAEFAAIAETEPFDSP